MNAILQFTFSSYYYHFVCLIYITKLTDAEGQLGYPSVDTQPTPRRVSSLKARIISVAAANKHSAAVADTGEVFTWGSNKEGQLGYGTSNSASNCIPRMVEYLKGRAFKCVSAAKYHTVALGTDGEVSQYSLKRNGLCTSSNIKKFNRLSDVILFFRCLLGVIGL